MPRCAPECRALPCPHLPAYNARQIRARTPMNDTRTDGARPQRRPGRGAGWTPGKRSLTHFNRDVTTVQRWERREGMPVHRHVHDKQGSVYAFRSELDAWWDGRRGKLPDSSDSAPEPLSSPPPVHLPPVSPKVPPEPETAAEPAPASGAPLHTPDQATLGAWPQPLRLAAARLRGLSDSATRPAEIWRNPLANATFTRLTDWPGIEQAAEISRDGRWVSFLADHDGHTDVWLTEIGSGSYRNLTRGDRIELVNPCDPHLRLLGRRLARHRMDAQLRWISLRRYQADGGPDCGR